MTTKNQETPRRRDYLVAMIQYLFMTTQELRVVENQVLTYDGPDSIYEYLARQRYQQVLKDKQAGKQSRLESEKGMEHEARNSRSPVIRGSNDIPLELL
jgi:hypothetical protein